MTEHLPECWAKHDSDPPAWCICEELRACEDRVARAFHVVRTDDTKQWEKTARNQFDEGYADGWDAGCLRGLDATREAIENLMREYQQASGPRQPDEDYANALADALIGIDALRKDKP